MQSVSSKPSLKVRLLAIVIVIVGTAGAQLIGALHLVRTYALSALLVKSAMGMWVLAFLAMSAGSILEHVRVAPLLSQTLRAWAVPAMVAIPWLLLVGLTAAVLSSAVLSADAPYFYLWRCAAAGGLLVISTRVWEVI